MSLPKATHLPTYQGHGDVIYKVVTNDGTPEAMMALVNAKTVFSTQLPKMPKEYIVRLVMDRNHRTMVIQQQSTGRIIGGICYRPFPTQRFAEIVFCAVTSTEQGKGYGRYVMAYLKEHVKNEGIDYFLTYADNYAIKYFAKQAFTKSITMHHDRWRNWIKDYDGATLMECGIIKEINYITINQLIRQQREALIERITRISVSHRETSLEHLFQQRKQLLLQEQEVKEAAQKQMSDDTATSITSIQTEADEKKKAEELEKKTQQIFPISIYQIPGIEALRSQLETYPAPRSTDRLQLLLTAKLSRILTALLACRDSWPFRYPVDRNVVVDYYTVITHPMDLTTMQGKLNAGLYTNSLLFEQDVALLVHNCKVYNGPQTSYFRHAEDFWVEYVQLAEKYQIHRKMKLTQNGEIVPDYSGSNPFTNQKSSMIGNDVTIHVHL